MSPAARIILTIAVGLALVLLAAGEAWHLAHPAPAPVFNFPVVPKKP